MTNQINFDELFKKFNGLKVLIVGDVMVDNYIIGKVDRVSPEAPVPVVDVTSFDSRLGGAGNVALNIKAMGGIPILCSVIGNDKEGEDLKILLEKQGLTSRAILSSDKRKTTTKTRILGNNHQLLRIDHEVKTEIDTLDSFLLEEHFNRELEIADVVIFEDYNKGVLHSKNIEKFIDKAIASNKPTIVDPKKSNFLSYNKTTLFKPNLKEIKEGLNVENNLETIEEILEAVTLLESKLNNVISMVTLSERGVLIKKGNEHMIIPAHIRNIADVSGAGDTVVSVAALCLALNTDIKTLAELSNLAGGLVCEKTGVVPIEKLALLSEAKRIHA
jgi:rfaE bifunctional protein kinase chain/domain